MKSIYISSILITLVFETITRGVHSTPLGGPGPGPGLGPEVEAAPTSPYASSYAAAADRVYRRRDAPSATTLPIARYSPSPSPRIAPPVISNGDDDEKTDRVKGDDEDRAADKLRSDVRNEMNETRSLLESSARRAREAIDGFVARWSDALRQRLRLESENGETEAAQRRRSLRERGRVLDGQLRSALLELRRQTYDRVRRMYFDFSNDVRSSRATLAALERDFPAYFERTAQNTRQQNRVRMEKLRSQFDLTVDELGALVERNRSHVFDLLERNKSSVARRLQDVANETTAAAKSAEKEMRDTFAQRQRDVRNAYAEATAAATATDHQSVEEYANRETENVTNEMKKIRTEMERKMMDGIRNVINTLRSEVKSIILEGANVREPTTSTSTDAENVRKIGPV